MNCRKAPLIVLSFCCFAPPASTTWAQLKEEQTVQAASAVFDETMTLPLRQIPQSLLSRAHGIAIIPNVIKGGFVVGARYGRGVLVIRDAAGNWQSPVFISLTGGNIGWQIGVQSTDVVLVFATRKSIQGILAGTFTIGADAAVAAGPVGRMASAGTDAHLKAEIYSYSRSRGVFAGVSIDGSVLRIDTLANTVYYQNAAGQVPVVPPSAVQLVQKVAAYAANPQTAAAVSFETPAIPPHSSEADMVRYQLAQMAPGLYAALNPEWASYLALPAEVFAGGPHPSSPALAASLARFDTVQADARFQTLAQDARFRSTHGLLKHYLLTIEGASSSLVLPPPPANTPSAN